jgi:hypothetical protein
VPSAGLTLEENMIHERQSIVDRIKDAHEAQRAVMGKIREIAQANGYVMVQKSPNRYMVIKLQGGGGYHAVSGREGYYTDLAGELVFTGTSWQCREYVADNTKPIPPELVRQSRPTY